MQPAWNQATPEAADAFMAAKDAAEAKIVSTISTDNLADTDLLELHGASFWDDVAFACLNCGTCTFSCPTCWCFDLQDEVHGKSGGAHEELGQLYVPDLYRAHHRS